MSIIAGAADPTDAPGKLDSELLDFVRTQMTELRIPGVSIGVTHGDRAAVAGFGITSIENPLPVDGDTLFELGSITKTITGTAIMQEVERGRIDLDATVRTYLPDFAVADEEISERVTVRHLMTHTCGWEGDIFETTTWGDDAIDLMIRRFTKLRQVTPFGTMWSYNNAAFYVLGRILEILHGRPYHEVIRSEVFEPLGIRRACFFGHEALLRRFVVGHAFGPAGLQIARPWEMPRSSQPVGTVICGVRELLRYARFHLGLLQPSHHVLSPETRERMQHQGMPGCVNGHPAGQVSGMGLTWMLGEVGGTRIVGHGGSAHGQPCDLSLLPEHGFAVAIQCNLQHPHTLARRVIRWVQERYFGVSESAPTPDPGGFGDLDEAVGTYDNYGMVLRVRRDGDALVLDTQTTRDWLDGMDPPTPPSSRRLIPVGPDTAVAEPLDDDDRVIFVRDERGAIRWLRNHHRAALRRDA